MKKKHGQRVWVYQATDYRGYRHRDTYLHPEITVQQAVICDCMEEFRQYGGDSCLEQAKRLRCATGDTFYLDLRSGFGQPQVVLRWQTHREDDGRYARAYALKIHSCEFNSESVALATKLVKLTTGEQPTDIVAALAKLKAVRCVYNRDADQHIFADHLDDDLFNLPAESRLIKA